MIDEILGLTPSHEQWRERCINLIGSENVTSPAVCSLFLLSLDKDTPQERDSTWARGSWMRLNNKVKNSPEKFSALLVQILVI